jgi:hypothetical protein
VTFKIDLTGANGDETIVRISAQAATAPFKTSVETAKQSAPANVERYRLLGN